MTSDGLRRIIDKAFCLTPVTVTVGSEVYRIAADDDAAARETGLPAPAGFFGLACVPACARSGAVAGLDGRRRRVMKSACGDGWAKQVGCGIPRRTKEPCHPSAGSQESHSASEVSISVRIRYHALYVTLGGRRGKQCPTLLLRSNDAPSNRCPMPFTCEAGRPKLHCDVGQSHPALFSLSALHHSQSEVPAGLQSSLPRRTHTRQ
jgi:hypothetical protein